MIRAKNIAIAKLGDQMMVPMVLNPNEIEPTFLKLDSWSPGAGFIPIITSNAMY